MSVAERRKHYRVQNFQIRQDNGQVIPIWVFTRDKDAIPALVIDLSSGGVRLLVGADSAPPNRFDLKLVPPEGSGLPEARLSAQQIRLGNSGEYLEVGCQFGDAAGDQPELQRYVEHFRMSTGKKVLRAEIHPA